MSAIFVCDGCGKRTEGKHGYRGHYYTPAEWYAQSDYDTGKTLDACSRECIRKVAAKENITTTVVPL